MFETEFRTLIFMRKITFANNHFYHVYNRGVEKRIIFNHAMDYSRFVRSLYEFNDEDATFNLVRDIRKDVRNRVSNIEDIKKEARGKPFVNVVCFCLMPNHFHLILEQLQGNGISRFMHKLGIGYTKYFNLKYERVGSLFQGPFKAIGVDTDEYLTHLSRYIHLNPVELIEFSWKKKGIKDWKRVNNFLDRYKWSSYSDYIGKENFSLTINNKFLVEYFDDTNDYKKFVNEWLVKDLEGIEDFIIE